MTDAAREVVENTAELQELMREYKRLEKLAQGSELTRDLFAATVELEKSGLIRGLLDKVLVEWEINVEAPREFVLKGIRSVLELYPTAGFLQLADMLKEQSEDEETPGLKDFFLDVGEAVLAVHESEVFQRYAATYMEVQQSEEPAVQEFVKLHAALQKKMTALAQGAQPQA